MAQKAVRPELLRMAERLQDSIRVHLGGLNKKKELRSLDKCTEEDTEKPSGKPLRIAPIVVQ